MSYQKKYWFQFTSKDNHTNVVELWHNTTDVLTAIEVKTTVPPFIVELPEIDHKFQVVRGTGCTINFLSETDMQFFDGLYHVDPTEFMVYHYIDTVLNWVGYLNAEMITEPYDINFNYTVSITGNDGFSLMDRISFLQSDETKYTGILSKFDILQIIFAKIGLPFTSYYISLSTTFTGQSSDSDSTILHESFVDCSNFYDEDDKPMSLREVTESILAPYGAHIRAESCRIYITDIHALASNTTIAYKEFRMSDGLYQGVNSISNRKTISSIGYLGIGQNIERSGGVNRQVIAYSPYPIINVLDPILSSLDEFSTVPATFSTKDGYSYRTLEDNNKIAIYLGNADLSFEESYYQKSNESNIYFRYGRISPPNLIQLTTLINQNNISVSGISERIDINSINRKYIVGTKLVITGNILAKTKLNPYDVNQSGWPIRTIVQYFVLKIGDQYWNDASGIWQSSYAYNQLITIGQEGKLLADSWNPIGYFGDGFEAKIGNLSTPGQILDGIIDFQILSYWQYQRTGSEIFYTNETSAVQEIWIKDLEIKIVNTDGSEISDNDIEYIGLLDRNYQNEGEKITLTCGTDSRFADRGKILKFNGTHYSDILQWTRNSQTFKIEELLLRSVSSNYRAGFITLLGMKLKNLFYLQNIITDSFTGSAKLMIKSAIINYYNSEIDCSLVEILPDELTIVPDSTVR